MPAAHDYAENSAALAQVFETLSATRTRLIERGESHKIVLVNATQFVVIWNWDLSTLLQLIEQESGSADTSNGWRRKLHTRVLALTAYEALIKLKDLFDPDKRRRWSLWNALSKSGVDPEFADVLRRAHDDVSALLSRHGDLLAGIRNNISGHRDNDATLQIEWMNRLEAQESLDLGNEMLALTTRLVRTLLEAMVRIMGGPWDLRAAT